MGPVEVAAAFAAALDAEDTAAARRWLAADVRYGLGEQRHVGPDAVCASYGSSAAWGAANLDALAYESVVRAGPDDTVVILFTDHIRRGDARHTYRCEQVLAFAAGEPPLISRITHRELGGERERLDAWFQQVGVDRAEGT